MPKKDETYFERLEREIDKLKEALEYAIHSLEGLADASASDRSFTRRTVAEVKWLAGKGKKPMNRKKQ